MRKSLWEVVQFDKLLLLVLKYNNDYFGFLFTCMLRC